MKQKKFGNYFVLRIEKGEDIIEALKRFASETKIFSAFFFGLGVGQDLELGFFDAAKKDYRRKKFNGEYEFTSLSGNISRFTEEPAIHCHVTITDQEFHAVGGHLFSAVIPATCEVIILPLDEPLIRFEDDQTGLRLLKL